MTSTSPHQTLAPTPSPAMPANTAPCELGPATPVDDGGTGRAREACNGCGTRRGQHRFGCARPTWAKQCKRCGKRGHTQGACSLPAPPRRHNCGQCGEPGHDARSCRAEVVRPVVVKSERASPSPRKPKVDPYAASESLDPPLPKVPDGWVVVCRACVNPSHFANGCGKAPRNERCDECKRVARVPVVVRRRDS